MNKKRLKCSKVIARGCQIGHRVQSRLCRWLPSAAPSQGPADVLQHRHRRTLRQLQPSQGTVVPARDGQREPERCPARGEQLVGLRGPAEPRSRPSAAQRCPSPGVEESWKHTRFVTCRRHNRRSQLWWYCGFD